MTFGRSSGWDNILRDVSRSFYLTLRILPASIREQIGLAYLLARATDTVADAASEPVSRRLELLRIMRGAVQDAGLGSRTFLVPQIETISAEAGESLLLERFGDLLDRLSRLAEADRRLIAGVLDTISAGQELDLTRFGDATSGRLAALETDAELEDYTWRVAGCVGEFWTRVCAVHLFRNAVPDVGNLLAEGIRFGKGLQLVNILRDVAADLRQGRCYVPSTRLAEAGLAPRDLLDPGAMPCFRALYDGYLQRADEHLAAGRRYVRALPWGELRVRLACTLPLEIGHRTIARLRTGNPLDPAVRIKISRREVRRVLFKSFTATLFGSGTPSRSPSRD